MKCIHISYHIGCRQCYGALFSRWGWNIISVTNPVNPWLVHAIKINKPGRLQQYYLRLKWGFITRILIFRRHIYGEKNYILLIRLCYSMRFINKEDYLGLLFTLRWGRHTGLSQPMRQALKHKAVRRLMNDCDLVVVSYSHVTVELAAALHEIYGVRVIAISAHRYDQHKNNINTLKKVNESVLYLDREQQAIAAVSEEYDYDYERHYLNITPRRLYGRPFFIRPGIESPQDNIVVQFPIRFDSFKNREFTQGYNEYCQKHDIKPGYHIRTLEQIYPSGYRQAEDLRKHAAFIMVPYSAYSCTNMEMYFLNVPVFIPSVRMMVERRAMMDRVLHPTWCSKQDYRKMRDDADDADSPNSYHPEAQRLWIARSFLYRRKHCIVFDSIDDLSGKLECLKENQDDIRHGMAEENRELNTLCLQEWREVLNELDVPLPETLKDTGEGAL